ncbi:hypothetical protein RI129_001413 [Pyrocoelia pectoralis]|uniref:Reverse transcriptase domain-containing protein n=1 Tax=Pyrocoelia pectoralis TaxID=417401 RepID=A0AAN7VVH4_9COLE
MGNPLSPVIANFYMEKFESIALESAVLKPKIWYRYVDDTFVIWNHGLDSLHFFFLKHLNNIHPNIQFTMECEINGRLPFLDILISKTDSLNLSFSVYRKPTHTDRYLNKLSNHHPCQKIGVIKALFDRAKKVSDPTHLDEELQHLRMSLQANGYSLLEINKVFSSKPKQLREKLPHLGMVFLPYIGGVTDKIGRILERNNIKTIFIPTKKISEFLRSPKDPLDPLTASGVYKILCSCGLVYIGTTKRSFLTRRKEHMRFCRLNQPEKSAIAEHALNNLSHDILFDNMKILSRTSNFYR